MSIVSGDLFSCNEKYICHQCNCVTTHAKFTAQNLFKKFPHADCYTTRNKRSQPGTILIKGDGSKHRFVINMFAQYYPGAPKYATDSKMQREKWFQACLDEISKIKDLESIAFPFGIGCGAAEGDWDAYYLMIKNFASNNEGIRVVIYKKDE